MHTKHGSNLSHWAEHVQYILSCNAVWPVLMSPATDAQFCPQIENECIQIVHAGQGTG